MSSDCRQQRTRLFCLWVLMALFCSIGMAQATDLRLVTLDVGMGQSILLVENGHGLLLDTGLAEYGEHVLARMKFHGVRSLDYLLLSHLHRDHAAGYSQVRAAWPDSFVLTTCSAPEELLPNEKQMFFMLQAVLERDPLQTCLAAGDTLQWRGHQLQVLWPVHSQQPNLNQTSLVLLFTSKQGGQLLIMGDVDRTVERKLIPPLWPFLQKSGIDFYVAAHHAAADSTDPDFLSLLRPSVSLVSVGRDNPNGYPSAESMAVLIRHSEKVLRTDRDGEICFNWDGKKPVPCILVSE
ncbi:MAG: MBL fold metallo-hydrolase [Desulfocapsa sp.]|nr:MBL fold metallo-hydrolase [Desulfocapsa sp.]